jgi:hypothetical protein
MTKNKNAGKLLALPCLGEAMRRGIIVTPGHDIDFHPYGAKSGSCAFQQPSLIFSF